MAALIRPAGWSLRARLLAILTLLLVIGIIVTGWAASVILRGYLVDQVDEKFTTASMKALLNQVAENPSNPYLGEYAVRLAYQTGDVDTLTSGNFDPGELPDFARLSPTATAPAEGPGEPFMLKTVDGKGEWRAAQLNVTVNTGFGRIPAVATVAQPLQDVDEALGWLRRLILLLGAAVTLACVVIGRFAIRRAFRPLAEVESTAAAIAAGDLSQRIPAQPEGTEVGRLTTSLNGMLAQIETAFHDREASEARTRRFAADASHELRTPLTAIRGFAELYRQGAVSEPDDVARTMSRIEDEARRMGALVDDLLLLARLDEQRPGRRDPVDLLVLAADAVEDARAIEVASESPAAPTTPRPISLVGLDGTRGPASALVIGDEDRLRQVVTNLVGNAVRHTPAGTPVEVAVGTATDEAGTVGSVIEVRDHGPGLDDEHTEKVFERFFRADPSRQRGRGGGTGLGLSIVAAVAASHGGTVQARETPGGGATFRVWLPAAILS